MAEKDKKSYIDKKVFIEAVLGNDYSAEKVANYLTGLGHQINKYNAQYRIDRLISKGRIPLRSGNTPEVGLLLKKTSTMYDSKGKVKLQWVTSEKGKEDLLTAFAKAISNITESVTPKRSVKAPNTVMDELMSVYTIGDAHVGMLAWKPESGEDNDLVTAQYRHINAMQMLVTQSNPTKEAFIVDVGDFYHSDNVDNRTAKSGNNLDVDGRFAKVLEIGLILTTTLIDLALKKHEIVRWRSAIGNHNEHSALMMNQFIKAYYRNEPRVIVHDTPAIFMYHQFGKNLIGITHGHTVKAEKLGEFYRRSA